MQATDFDVRHTAHRISSSPPSPRHTALFCFFPWWFSLFLSFPPTLPFGLGGITTSATSPPSSQFEFSFIKQEKKGLGETKRMKSDLPVFLQQIKQETKLGNQAFAEYSTI
jgi:hypothetical protein